MIEFRAGAAMGKRVRGRALVAKDGFLRATTWIA